MVIHHSESGVWSVRIQPSTANKVPSYTFSSSFLAFYFIFLFEFFFIQWPYTKASAGRTGPTGANLTIATAWTTKRVKNSNKDRGEGRPVTDRIMPRRRGSSR
ncbi:hypothetical protein BDV32DRAFT_118285 [Aspergillus pseudonomiae]|nr:hypothetical protein BDV32DRAFT_118285 [Aspergillus pseudonomiae]